MARKKAFIIGGTGQIGQATAQTLLGLGWDITLTHRGNTHVPQHLIQQGVKIVLHDRNNDELGSVLGSGADLLIDTIAYDDKHGKQLLEVQGSVGFFIVISSSSVYCDEQGRSLDEARINGFPDVPEMMTEKQTTLPPSNDNYSTRKVALELCLLENAITPVTILRPCAIHGVNSTHPREWWFVKRLMDGRNKIPLAYKGKSRFHTTAVENIARLIATVIDNKSPPILNVGDAQCLTVTEIGQIIADYLGFSVSFVDGEQGFDAIVGKTPWSVPAPFMIDCSLARSLGFKPKSYAETIPPVCDWLVSLLNNKDQRQHFPVFDSYPHPPFDYKREDNFLNLYS